MDPGLHGKITFPSLVSHAMSGGIPNALEQMKVESEGVDGFGTLYNLRSEIPCREIEVVSIA